MIQLARTLTPKVNMFLFRLAMWLRLSIFIINWAYEFSKDEYTRKWAARNSIKLVFYSRTSSLFCSVLAVTKHFTLDSDKFPYRISVLFVSLITTINQLLHFYNVPFPNASVFGFVLSMINLLVLHSAIFLFNVYSLLNHNFSNPRTFHLGINFLSMSILLHNWLCSAIPDKRFFVFSPKKNNQRFLKLKY